MKVTDHYFDCKTGERGVREIEMPGVLTEAEAAKLPYGGRLLYEVLAELRAQLLDNVLLGIDDSALRAEYSRLRATCTGDV